MASPGRLAGWMTMEEAAFSCGFVVTRDQGNGTLWEKVGARGGGTFGLIRFLFGFSLVYVHTTGMYSTTCTQTRKLSIFLFPTSRLLFSDGGEGGERDLSSKWTSNYCRRQKQGQKQAFAGRRRYSYYRGKKRQTEKMMMHG